MKLFVRFTSRIIRPHSECVELAGIDITLSPVVKVFHVKITLTRSNMYLCMLRLSSPKPAGFFQTKFWMLYQNFIRVQIQTLDIVGVMNASDFLTMI